MAAPASSCGTQRINVSTTGHVSGEGQWPAWGSALVIFSFILVVVILAALLASVVLQARFMKHVAAETRARSGAAKPGQVAQR